MNISSYADFFHDGSLMDIQHIGDKIELFMASAENLSLNLETDFNVSNRNDRSHYGVLSVIIFPVLFCLYPWNIIGQKVGRLVRVQGIQEVLFLLL